MNPGAKFAYLDERYIQQEEVFTALQAHFHKSHASLNASVRELSELRDLNATLASKRDAARQSDTALPTRGADLEVQDQVLHTRPPELAEAIRECDHCHALQWSVAAQVGALQTGYDDIVSRHRSSQ